MYPTPTKTDLELNLCQFPSLREALDYAARGETGYNFYDRRGRLTAVLSYARLREEARAVAAHLRALDLPRGSRVALVAETQPEFLHAFFACQYVGLVPVALPMSIHAGSHEDYVTQLRGLLAACDASVALASDGYSPYLLEAAGGLPIRFVGTHAELREQPATTAEVETAPADFAYIQYTSGSTRFPRGVMITHRALTENLRGMLDCVAISAEDRCCSWLPLYHDMGLVGMVLAPLASQRSVDFLPTHDFAMAPLQWLALISENKATISFSPPFGFELCTRRLRGDGASRYSLESWRIAGVGAEMIRAGTLASFADAFRPAGFDERAFLPSYGMAECALAVSFPRLGRGVEIDRVDAGSLERGEAQVSTAPPEEEEGVRSLVQCGRPLPGHAIEIRGEDGRALPDRCVGSIFVHGPSNMTGYFQAPDATRDVITRDGWLDTGDLGYWTGESLVITGRKKDLIIIKGRNVSPADLEVLTEEKLGLRMGDALSFASEGPDGTDEAVIVVQSRVVDAEERAGLARKLKGAVRMAFGFDCHVEFVAPGVLPRTSSGKLSRTAARIQHQERKRDLLVPQPPPAPAEPTRAPAGERTARTARS